MRMRTQALAPPTNVNPEFLDMAERSPAPSPRIVSEDRRNHAFRSLVSDIAERLSDSDVQNIIWQQDVPSQNKVTVS